MHTEKVKMLTGELYDPSDAELVEERHNARKLCHDFNSVNPDAAEKRHEILETLFGMRVDGDINPPFFCDYGYNISLGKNVYFNVNCVVLDVAPVKIGSNTLFGPGVHIYAASHPMSAVQRAAGLEFGKPVVIEDDVWVGGGAIICPGVTVGKGSVIGAGSVVTRDIPAGVFAAGNPCRVIRAIDD